MMEMVASGSEVVDSVEGGQESDEDIGPPLPPGFSKEEPSSQQDSDDDEGGNEEEEEEDVEDFDRRFPLSHEITLSHGSKPISALTLDPSGARVVTGGYDYNVRLWDFAGMDSTFKSFRTITPCQSHQISSVQYSNTGDTILVTSGSAQAKVMDRDGMEKMECPKGWPYIANMANTSGHIAMVNCGCWHPRIREHFLTCSNDGSLRVWDVNEKKKQLHVIKGRDKQGRKIAVNTCAYSRDGGLIAGALYDGSIQIWKNSSPFTRSQFQHFTAHTAGSETCSLCFSHDNHTLISRGGDNTLKLWDLRSFKRPVNVVTELDTFFSGTDCVFSPNEQVIMTGTSVKKGQGKGKLMFFDRELNEVYQLAVSDASVVRCIWHPKLNQIVVGCSDGQAKVYFSPKHSFRGAKLCANKKKRKKDISEISLNTRIITPHALPLFRDDEQQSLKRKREKARADPKISHKPDPPLHKGAGGRVGTGGSSIGAYVRKIAALERPVTVEKDVDPREALLKYAKKANEKPFWVTPAYTSTQPKVIFQEEESSEEED
ncbi:WD repeat-containing protein 70-like isoform X2 [Halichondria panicea]